MKKAARQRGFTLAEVLIAMVGSVIIIGALLAGSIGLQRSFHASESYATSQSDERRLIDYIARDLRRAIGIAACGASGANVKVVSGPARLDESSSLIVTLPAYYQTNSKSEAAYDQALPVIAAGDRVAYGTASGPAPEFSIAFRKLFIASEGCVCFVRDEGDTRQVIVRDAADLGVQITVAADGASCALEAQFHSQYSANRSVVAVHDEVMLRNIRID
ncbi:MAG TPA: prepilin-type N-terminal cleavage/methylation domain-containing protein [Chthoniobacteraceae bacterium]|nr:prepilin-type N-terminal cleavage/methylation domain-containing protein [Chthoniobacteraceae bacterium]